MARVTVEDCIDKVQDRFELVALASSRAKQISSGAQVTVNAGKDKPSVIALREIAMGTVSPEKIKDAVIKGMQKTYVVEDVPEEIDNYTDEQEDSFEFLTSTQDYGLPEGYEELEGEMTFEDEQTFDDDK